MSLMDNIKDVLENRKVQVFNDFDEDELEEEAYVLEGELQDDDEDLDLSDDELDALIKEIEEDIRVLEPESEEDPDLLEDEDVEAYESFVNFLLESDNDEEDPEEEEEEDLNDIEAGLDAVEDFMEDEYEDMIKAGVDPEDYED